jgi:hypothetical protein
MTGHLKPKFASKAAEENNIFDIPLRDHLEHTGMLHLPQAPLITSTVDALKNTDLVEAYLRGSFSSGEADELSDIDLFVVVEPEKLPDTYHAFVEHVKQTHEILVACHDKLVKDYGGIGWMFVCKDKNDKLLQFDFYAAIKGTPPKALLVNSPRIFTRNPEYSWLEEKTPVGDLPGHTSKFITQHTGGDTKTDKVKYYMTDLMVTLSIMKKHLQRGQHARALNDNNHAIGVSVELLRLVSDENSHHSALYAADKLVAKCAVSQDPVLRKLSGELQNQFLAPLNPHKIRKLFAISELLVREYQPEAYAEMAGALNGYKQCVMGCGALAGESGGRKPRRAALGF